MLRYLDYSRVLDALQLEFVTLMLVARHMDSKLLCTCIDTVEDEILNVVRHLCTKQLIPGHIHLDA